MLFLTNRFPQGSIRTRVGRPFEFDLRNNAPSNSVFFCEQASAESSYIEIGSKNFLARLRDSTRRQLLLYIHGFNTMPDGAFKLAEELQIYCDQNDADEILVVPLIWPCDNDLGIVQDYWDDQKSADASAFAFARALDKFIAWRDSSLNEHTTDACLKRINVLAHSMGNRVLRETLACWNKYDLADGVPLIFRNSFLIAADIENESIHRDQRGGLISDASRNVTVFFASDDLALRASKAANLKNKIASRRLGHTGPENIMLTAQNVYSVDCDNFNNQYDVPLGHTYFLGGTSPGAPGVVFKHLYSCLKSGRVFPGEPSKRSAILDAEGGLTYL